MRVNLSVPFAAKDEAKRLGARWDAHKKVWYVQNLPDLTVFARWLNLTEAEMATLKPAPEAASDKGSKSAKPAGVVGKPASKATPVQKMQSVDLVIVGSQFVEMPQVCDCLPWESCTKCEAISPFFSKA